MSEVKVNKISPRSGTDVTLGDASDTFTIPASATLDVNGTIDVTGATVTGLSAGKVLQVIYASYSTQLSTTTSSWLDLGLSAAITPSATDSKIFAHWIISARLDDDCGYYAQLVRDTTAVYTPAFSRDIYANQSGGETQRIDMRHPTFYLDSPSTTSATTYKIQVLTYSTSTILFQYDEGSGGLTSQLVLWEIGA